MAKPSASSLLSTPLIARKGEAAPAVAPQLPEPMALAPAANPIRPTETAKGTAGTIAVTVRLDPERYERLKIFGVRRRKTNQEILVTALDAHLAANA
jgi:hypothetical protein